MIGPRAVAAALALASIAGTIPARADDVAEAKARFRRGVALYKEHRWLEAVAEFEAAYRIKPHGAIHFNVAQCRERLGDWPGALRSYQDYLRETPSASDRAAVRASIAHIEERLASSGTQVVLVYTDPPGAWVTLGGRERGTTPVQAVLAPGSYALAISLEGYERVVQQVEVSRTESRVVDVVLRPVPKAPAAAGPDLSPRAPAEPVPVAPAAPPPSWARRHLRSSIAAGAAVVAAAAGAYLGWSARQDENAIRAMSTPNRETASQLASDAQSKARAANVLYAVAGGAAAVGGTLFVFEVRF